MTDELGTPQFLIARLIEKEYRDQRTDLIMNRYIH